MTCDDVRGSAAAALLADEPFDDDLRAHLAACAGCRDEVTGLGAVTALLPLTGIVGGAATASSGPDELALRRLLAAAGESSRRRRRHGWLLAAAGVLVAAGAAVGIVVIAGSDDGAPPGVTARASDPASGVSGTVRVTAAGAGSRLAFEVSGVASGTTCRLVVVDTEGATHELSTWTAEYDGTASLTTTSTVAPQQVDAVQLLDVETGQPLLTLTPAP